jgi:hypothetical protein
LPFSITIIVTFIDYFHYHFRHRLIFSVSASTLHISLIFNIDISLTPEGHWYFRLIFLLRHITDYFHIIIISLIAPRRFRAFAGFFISASLLSRRLVISLNIFFQLSFFRFSLSCL